MQSQHSSKRMREPASPRIMCQQCLFLKSLVDRDPKVKPALRCSVRSGQCWCLDTQPSAHGLQALTTLF